MNELVRDVASFGDRSSLDTMIIGLPQAGSTTLFWRLANQKKFELNNRLNQSSNIADTSDVDTTKQGMHFLRRISLDSEGRKAVLFHGSSKSTTRKRMYPYYGLTQCMIIVLPAQIGSDLAAFKNRVGQLLIPAFALCGHLNWIFAVNKMDTVDYNEAVFNEVVSITTAICNKISMQIMNKASFIPISATHSYNLVRDITKNGNTDNSMAWYKGPSVLEKMNEISLAVTIPLHTFISNARVAVVRGKPLENTKNLAAIPKSGTYLVQGYVTNGVIATGDVLHVQPEYVRFYNSKTLFPVNRMPFTVKSIQVFNKEQKEAVAGTFVGLHLLLDGETYFKPYFYMKYRIGTILNNLILPIYHHLSTAMSLDVADLGVTRNVGSSAGLSTLKAPHRFELPTKVIEADIVVLASKCGNWDGKIRANLSTGFYSFNTHTYCTVAAIKSSTDQEGQNYVENPTAVVKGQRARVRLTFASSHMMRKYRNSPSGEGRILLVMYERVVAIGVITTVEKLN
jgi:translation elongation factor EF-1alpha